MSTTPDKLVERYLKHLEVELDDLPRRPPARDRGRDRRAHRRGAGRARARDARPTCATSSRGSATRRTIAEDARERFEVHAAAARFAATGRAGWRSARSSCFSSAAIVLPLVGWLIGVILLWLSNAWNVRDKVIGTLFVPGGLGLSLFLLFFAAARSGRAEAGGLRVRSGDRTSDQLHEFSAPGSRLGDFDALSRHRRA